nr:suppressor of disruption of TFIIS [Ipomoea batatas]
MAYERDCFGQRSEIYDDTLYPLSFGLAAALCGKNILVLVHGRLPYGKPEADPVLRSLLISLAFLSTRSKFLEFLDWRTVVEGIICFETLEYQTYKTAHLIDDDDIASWTVWRPTKLPQPGCFGFYRRRRAEESTKRENEDDVAIFCLD